MYRVKEASQLLGLPISSLHYYERAELVIPLRLTNSYRCYTDVHIEQLKLVVIMKEYGFPLADIKHVMTYYLRDVLTSNCKVEAHAFFTAKINEFEQKITEYKMVIQLMEKLPLLLNGSDSPGETEKMKLQTIDMRDELFSTIMLKKKASM